MSWAWSRRGLEREALASEEAAATWTRLLPYVEDGTPGGDQAHAKFRELATSERGRAVEAIRRADTPAWRRRPLGGAR